MVEKTIRKKLDNPADLDNFRQLLLNQKDSNKLCITVCAGTGCIASGADLVVEAFKEEIKKREIGLIIDFKKTGCHGFCEWGPLVVIRPEKILYTKVTPEDIPEIVESISLGTVVERLLYIDPATNEKIVHEYDVPFYKQQTRIVFGANGDIDPANIEDYIASGGYSALSKVLFHMSPEQVIGEITKSGLRGRGGGGFPTGKKWQSTREAEGNIKYVIVNADEGDPGCYQDRSLVEGNPQSILEGLIIGAFAIGAHHGFIYIRNEYPLAVKNANIAIEQARQIGLLGKNILGSGFDFDVNINRGGGAFICGESSALIASLEGKIGEPKAKYIHMSEKGLWDKPSLLNNVKTWANVPLIVNHGSEWYSGIGTAGSKGTMIFSLVGKITNTGLVEVPFGITLREMIFNIGGGIPDGKKFKAIQTGGPSGGVIPEQYLDTPVDFDELAKLGSIMGSGGLIVMDEDTCMVDIARYFVNFLQGESCGKCTPCREGLTRMGQILDRITKGDGEIEDLQTLEDIADLLKNGALCALGSTAANPTMTTLQYFKDEYLSHIQNKKCPAGVCTALIEYSIDTEKCKACLRCIKECPTNAITGEKKKPESFTINQGLCIKCGSCTEVCKFHSIVKK